jgi:hypothetical protein
MSEKTKERLFELALIAVGLIGLLILFTVIFAGPRIIINYVLGMFGLSLNP